MNGILKYFLNTSSILSIIKNAKLDDKQYQELYNLLTKKLPYIRMNFETGGKDSRMIYDNLTRAYESIIKSISKMPEDVSISGKNIDNLIDLFYEVKPTFPEDAIEEKYDFFKKKVDKIKFDPSKARKEEKYKEFGRIKREISDNLSEDKLEILKDESNFYYIMKIINNIIRIHRSKEESAASAKDSAAAKDFFTSASEDSMNVTRRRFVDLCRGSSDFIDVIATILYNTHDEDMVQNIDSIPVVKKLCDSIVKFIELDKVSKKFEVKYITDETSHDVDFRNAIKHRDIMANNVVKTLMELTHFFIIKNRAGSKEYEDIDLPGIDSIYPELSKQYSHNIIDEYKYWTDVLRVRQSDVFDNLYYRLKATSRFPTKPTRKQEPTYSIPSKKPILPKIPGETITRELIGEDIERLEKDKDEKQQELEDLLRRQDQPIVESS